MTESFLLHSAQPRSRSFSPRRGYDAVAFISGSRTAKVFTALASRAHNLVMLSCKLHAIHLFRRSSWAGKTTVSCLIAALLSVWATTAGALIRETACGDIVSVGDKAVPNADTNQALWPRELECYRACVAGPILLDGHFSMLGPSGLVIGIPMPVTDALSPVAALLVEADHRIVHDSLLKRDDAAPPTTSTSLPARRERACADAVRPAAILTIPVWTLRGDADSHQAAHASTVDLRPLLAGAS